MRSAVLGALLGPLLLASSAAAVDVQLEVGLDDLLVEEAWAPVAARVQLDAADPPLDGRVVVDRPRELVGLVEAPVRVAPGASATVRLAVPPGAGSGLTVRVVDGQGRTLATSLPAHATTTLAPDERLVLLVGRGLLAVGDGRRVERLRLARVAPGALPRDPRVLQAATTIVLKGAGDPDLVELVRDPAAVAALERWVRAGGRLVVASADRPAWGDGPLDALLPARVDGTPVVERAADVVDALGVVSGDVPVTAAAPRPGAVVVAGGARWPLLVERRLGRGCVALALVDVDRDVVRGAERADAFLDRLLAPGAAPPAGPRAQEVRDLARAALAEGPALDPGWAYLLTGATLLLALGVTLLPAWAGRRLGPWAGLAVPPAAALLVAAGVLVASSLRGAAPSASALAVVVTDAPGEVGAALVEVALAAGGRTTLGLDLPAALRPRPDPRPAPDPLRLRAAPPRLVAAAGRDGCGVEGLELAPRGGVLVGVDGDVVAGDGGAAALLEGAPRVAVRLRPRPDAGGALSWPEVELTSSDDRPLAGLLLLVVGPTGARTTWVGALAPGGTFTWDPAAAPPLAAPPLEALSGGGVDALARGEPLLLLVAGQLEAAWTRGLAAAAATPAAGTPGRPAPGAWALHADRPAGAPLTVRGPDGPLPAVHVVRVTCVAGREAAP